VKKNRLRNSILYRPLSIALGYFAIAVIWIIYSDLFLSWLTSDPDLIQQLQTVKGIFYVAVTTVILYFFISRGQRNLKQSADKVLEQEERYRHLVDDAPYLIAVHQNDEIVFANKAALEKLEADSSDQVIGKHVRNFVHPDYWDSTKDRIQDFSNTSNGKPKYPAELKYISVKGNSIPVEVRANPIMYNDEPAWQVLAEDISDRLKRENLLVTMVDEKNILLSEIHHRVKNNMAIISALMQLQAMETDDEQVEDKLYESINRVKSIALIHDQLYESQNLAEINVSDIVHALVDEIQNGPIVCEHIEIDLRLQDLKVNINHAVSLSLFLNEALTNVFKHSFDQELGGKCRIECSCEQETALIQIVCSGKKVELYSLRDKESNLGISLMEMMAEQLEGEFILEKLEGGILAGVRFDPKMVKKGASAHHIFS
jgi:PAS domain S-box-containing protein